MKIASFGLGGLSVAMWTSLASAQQPAWAAKWAQATILPSCLHRREWHKDCLTQGRNCAL
jgi:hypothetical protein